ncbi:unnamed protein product [Urochloa humidicola]
MAGRTAVVVRTDAARAMSREAVATTDELRRRPCEWNSLPGATLSSSAGHSLPSSRHCRTSFLESRSNRGS